MTFDDICRHERLEMAFHSLDQHNAHVWTWLLHLLKCWRDEHPFTEKEIDALARRFFSVTLRVTP